MSLGEWFSDLFTGIVESRTVDFVVTSALSVGGTMPSFAPLKPDENYLSIKVKSLRLVYRRRFTSRRYGVVHSFANLPGAGQGAKEFVSATTPAALTALDPESVSNIISIDKPVVGPTPWRGGDLRLQIGLFSVVERELAGPFLSTLTSLSDKVGVAFASSAKPFLDVISAGVSALSRQTGSVKLEIGLDRAIQPVVPGHYAVIAAPVGTLDGAQFDLDANDGKLKVDGAYYDEHPYLVFTIEAVDQQDRWGDIPELKAAYALIRDAGRANKQKEAQQARDGFRLMALSSDDLTMTDALKLVESIDKWLKVVFGSSNTSFAASSSRIPEFAELGLYPKS